VRESAAGDAAPVRQDRWLEDEVDLGWYADALTRHWRIIAVSALLCAAIAFGVASRQPTMYRGSTTLLVVPPPRTPNATTSTSMFRAMVENLMLAAEVIAEAQLNLPPHSLTPQSFIEDALTVEELRGTNVLRVHVELRDPELAADASRRLARKALVLAAQLNQQEGSSIQEQLKTPLTEAAARLQVVERELLAYQQSAQLELLKEDTAALLDERRDLLRLLIDIESEKARLRAAEQEIARQAPILSVDRAIGSEAALRRAQQESTETGNGSAPASGAATRSARAGAEVDPEMLDLSNSLINPIYQTLDFQIATSRARLAALEQQRQELVDVRKIGAGELTKLSELYRRQLELARLQSNYDLAKRVHGDLALRHEESRTLALGNSPQLQIVDEAQPPDRPISKRRAQWAALGFGTGLLGAAFLALTREGRSRRPSHGRP
jgi:uncharacterized protein involved in exopolysaccharide biosynthesis